MIKKIELIWNIIHYFVHKADYRLHLLFNKINPFLLIHKIPFQKRIYERKGINIFEDIDNSFKNPKYGLSSIRAGGIMFGLSIFISVFIFCILTSLNKKYLPDAFFFILPVLFGVFTYGLLFYKDKYLAYFKIFETKTRVWKKKWAWISFAIIMVIILLLILGVNIMTYSIHH